MRERNTQFSRSIKRGFMLLVLIAGVAAALPAISGREVIENVEDKPSGDTMHSLVQMTLIDSSGSEKQRLIENWSKESQEGNKSIIVFHKPASVENTRFLTVENPGRDKRMTVSRIEKVQGFWTPINTTMKNLQTGHSTRLDIQRLVYNEELQDGLFTVNFLKTGRS